jgi:hypothetical protein
MTQQITTHVHRAQRARRKREIAERREAFRLLREIPLDQLTPEQTHRRFYYNVREDKLFWRTATGKLRPANETGKLKSDGKDYDTAEIITKYIAHKETLPVRVTGVEGALRMMHVASVDKRKAEERQARTLELQTRRLERQAKAAQAAKDNHDKPFVFKPTRKATSNTADELMALAREIKEQD